MELFGQFASVAFVLALAGLAAWWLRKGRTLIGLQSLGRTKGLKRMQLLERLPLSPQHHLCVVRINNSEWIIGIYPNGMKVIQRDKNPAGESAAPGQSGEPL